MGGMNRRKRSGEHTDESWNAAYPIGTSVRYWPIYPPAEGFPPHDTTTRSEAWTLGDGSAVVLIEGRSGGVHLSHIEVRDAVKIAMEWKAEAERLRKLFDDAGQGEHNALALIDHYQQQAFEADERDARRLQRVLRLLGDHGCDCECDCDSDGHDADCELCLACRIEKAATND